MPCSEWSPAIINITMECVLENPDQLPAVFYRLQNGRLLKLCFWSIHTDSKYIAIFCTKWCHRVYKHMVILGSDFQGTYHTVTGP